MKFLDKTYFIIFLLNNILYTVIIIEMENSSLMSKLYNTNYKDKKR